MASTVAPPVPYGRMAFLIGNSVPLPDVVYTDNYRPIRRTRMLLLGHALMSCAEFVALPMEQQQNMIMELERGCMKYTMDHADALGEYKSWTIVQGKYEVESPFASLYRYRAKELVDNLNCHSEVNNAALARRLALGELDPYIVSRSMVKTFCPERYAALEEELRLRYEVQFDRRGTVMYECPNCSAHDSTPVNKIKRSLDEGVDIEATCNECGTVWFVEG